MKKFTVITRDNIIPIKHLVTEENHIRIEWIFQGDDLEIKDEYHTMHELYQHRMALNIFLFKMMFKLDEQVRGEESRSNPLLMRSKLHYDGTMFDGYFIVIAFTNVGQISYHYKLKHWDDFSYLPEVERVPRPFDGHGSKEVIERLMKL